MPSHSGVVETRCGRETALRNCCIGCLACCRPAPDKPGRELGLDALIGPRCDLGARPVVVAQTRQNGFDWRWTSRGSALGEGRGIGSEDMVPVHKKDKAGGVYAVAGLK
jgi:hypothetical protein